MYKYFILPPRGYGKTMTLVDFRIRAIEYHLQQWEITHTCEHQFIRDEFPALYDRIMYGINLHKPS